VPLKGDSEGAEESGSEKRAAILSGRHSLSVPAPIFGIGLSEAGDSGFDVLIAWPLTMMRIPQSLTNLVRISSTPIARMEC